MNSSVKCKSKSGIGIRRHGFGAVEAITVLAVMIVIALFMLMILPRRRETARMVSCRRNLMQIGVGLALYDQGQHGLPYVPPLGGESAVRGSSPLMALLVELGQPDLTDVTDTGDPQSKRRNPAPEGGRDPRLSLCKQPPRDRGALPLPGKLQGDDR